MKLEEDMEGTFTVRAPFNNTVSEDMYLVVATRGDIFILVDSNADPLNQTYIKNGLTVEEFEQAKVDNIKIIGFRTESGDLIYVPENYIESFRKYDGVPYRDHMIAVRLPALPVSVSLDDLFTRLGELCNSVVGVTPTIDLIPNSETIKVDYDADAHNTMLREQNINNTDPYNEIVKLTNALSKVTDKKEQLECFIKENHCDGQ